MRDSQNSARPLPPWPRRALRLSITVTLVTLIALAAAAWVTSARQSQGAAMAPGIGRLFDGARMDQMDGVNSPSGAMNVFLFLSMWVTMMVAMMFPSAAPMVAAHWRLTYQRGGRFATVPLLAAGYLLSWTAVGVVAFALYRAILRLAPSLSLRSASMLAGGILVAAGVYQFTPLKSVCLRHCRNPVEFLAHWKEGLAGAARMGVKHGLYCVGCCWGLMLVLFAVGLANIAWMGFLAAVIFLEKIAPFGWAVRKGVGAGLVVLGGAVVAMPALFAGSLLTG